MLPQANTLVPGQALPLYLTGEQLELEPQDLVVYQLVPSELSQGLFQVFNSGIVAARQREKITQSRDRRANGRITCVMVSLYPSNSLGQEASSNPF